MIWSSSRELPRPEEIGASFVSRVIRLALALGIVKEILAGKDFHFSLNLSKVGLYRRPIAPRRQRKNLRVLTGRPIGQP